MVTEWNDKPGSTQITATVDFVEVMFARNAEEARNCLDLLQGFGIPARLEPDFIGQEDVALLVPTDDLERASHLLASRAQDEDESDHEDDDEEEDDDSDLDDDDEFDDDLDDDDDFDDDEDEEEEFGDDE